MDIYNKEVKSILISSESMSRAYVLSNKGPTSNDNQLLFSFDPITISSPSDWTLSGG